MILIRNRRGMIQYFRKNVRKPLSLGLVSWVNESYHALSPQQSVRETYTYLYDIDPKLVSVFLKAVIKDNKDIMDLDYIQWLI